MNPRSYLSPPRRQAGLTLVELLTALVVGMLLMTGVVQIFLSSKQTVQMNDSLARLQENARYAVQVMARDIRMAGSTGCKERVTGLSTSYDVHFSSGSFDPTVGIEGWEANNTGSGSYSIIEHAAVSDASTSGWTTSGGRTMDSGTNSVANSDVLRVWRVYGNPGVVTTVDTANDYVITGSTLDLDDGDLVLLSDCAFVDIFQACITGSTYTFGTAGNCANDGQPPRIREGGHLYGFEGVLYYIGKRADSATNPPSLFRRVTDNSGTAGVAQELVEGVESIQVYYGEDTDGDADANRFVTASNVTDWASVVSVRLNLLLQSLNADLVDGSIPVTFNGTTVNATDGRLRYPFSATVTLRNRVR